MMELEQQVKNNNDEDQQSLIREDPEIDEKGEARDYEVALQHAGFGLFHILLLFVNAIVLLSDVFELMAVAFVLPIMRHADEFSASDVENAVLSSVVFIGMLCGSYTWGGFSDVLGRRVILIISLTVNGIFGAMSAFSPNISVFILCRFLSGVGVGGSLPVIFAYIAELTFNKYRGPYMSIQSFFWGVGRVTLSGVAWLILPLNITGFHSWRLFILLSSLPAFCGAILYCFIPESPIFLLNHGRTEKAMKNLRLVHRLNHLHKKEAHFSIKSVRVKAAQADHGDKIVATQRGDKVKASLKKLLEHTRELYSRTYIKQTLLLSTVLFTLAFGSYGVMLWFPSYVQQITDAERASEFSKFCHDTPSTNNVSLSDYCDCQGSSFSHQHFINTNFSNFKLTNCSFHSVLFKDITFTDTLLEDCMFINCSLDNVRFGSRSALVSVRWINTTFLGVNVSESSVCEGEGEEEEEEEGSGERGGETASSLVGRNNSCGDVEVKCREKSDKGKVYRDTLLISLSATPGNIVSAIAVYFMRRNYWMAISMFSSTASVFLLYVAQTEVFVVVVLCVFTALSAPAWNDMNLLNSDLYPTHLRSSSLGMHLLFARIGAILGTNVFGLFIHVNPAVPILLVSSLFLVGSIASLPLPKTTRKTVLQ